MKDYHNRGFCDWPLPSCKNLKKISFITRGPLKIMRGTLDGVDKVSRELFLNTNIIDTLLA